jgi:hypothetical protein
LPWRRYCAAGGWCPTDSRRNIEINSYLHYEFFLVNNLETDHRTVVRFYTKRGTAGQWIKEGKQAVKMTRLSCHRCWADPAGGIAEAAGNREIDPALPGGELSEVSPAPRGRFGHVRTYCQTEQE